MPVIRAMHTSQHMSTTQSDVGRVDSDHVIAANENRLHPTPRTSHTSNTLETLSLLFQALGEQNIFGTTGLTDLFMSNRFHILVSLTVWTVRPVPPPKPWGSTLGEHSETVFSSSGAGLELRHREAAAPPGGSQLLFISTPR